MTVKYVCMVDALRKHTHILFYLLFIYSLYLLFWFIDNTGVAYQEPVTSLRWQLADETCWGNLIRIIKGYNTPEHLLVILHWIMNLLIIFLNPPPFGRG
jgi:hypothetical protein